MTSGILVVDRISLMRHAIRSGVLDRRKPSSTRSAEEVFRLYRGFDGEAWPDLAEGAIHLSNGLADFVDWPVVSRYVDRERTRRECDVIAISPVGVSDGVVAPSGWVFAGFDFGFFESEVSHFSVLLNEVVFGAQQELREYFGRLNGHLLLSSLGDVVSLSKERSKLVGLHRDVERVLRAEAVAVFFPRT